jgi:hypothetical protein
MTAGPRTRCSAAARAAACGLMACAALLAAPLAQAQPAAAGTGAAALHRYPGADLALGEKLVREHKCTECHVRKLGGDGSAIYRPKGRINSPAALATMVEMCNTELNLGMFPEDVLSVAAVLQRDHYRFAARP